MLLATMLFPERDGIFRELVPIDTKGDVVLLMTLGEKKLLYHYMRGSVW